MCEFVYSSHLLCVCVCVCVCVYVFTANYTPEATCELDSNVIQEFSETAIIVYLFIVYLLQGAEHREHVCRQRLQHVVVKIKGSVGRLDILVPTVGYISIY